MMMLFQLIVSLSVLLCSAAAQMVLHNESTTNHTNLPAPGTGDYSSSFSLPKPVPHPLPLPPMPAPLPPPPPADIRIFEDQLFAGKGYPYQKFGHATAANGGTVAVSTSPTSADARVYLYREHLVNGSQVGFRLEGELASPNPKLDGFGTSLAIQDQLVVVGAPKDNAQGFSSGKAYLFSLSTPLPPLTPVTHSLSPSKPQKGSQFGQSVAISGSTIAVGAPGYSVDAIKSCGAVYIFQQLNGSSQIVQTQQLLGTDASTSPFGQFGGVVSLTEDQLAVSAAGSSNVVLNGGAVHLYEPTRLNGTGDSWALVQTLQPSSPTSFAFFGHSTAFASRVALVAAYNDEGSGVVYVFTREGTSNPWLLANLLLPTDTSDSYNAFGSSLLLHESHATSSILAVVGSSGDSTQSEMAGAVYVYGVRDSSVSLTFTLLEKLTSNDTTSFIAYGHALCETNGHLLVSAPLADSPAATTAGVVYVESNLVPYYLEVVSQVEAPSSGGESTGESFATLVRNALLSTVGVVLLALVPAAAVTGITVLLVVRSGSKSHKYFSAPLSADGLGNTSGSEGNKLSGRRRSPYTYFVNPMKRRGSAALPTEDVELPGLLQTTFTSLDALYAPVDMHQVIRSPMTAEHTIYPSPNSMTQRAREALDKEESKC